MMIDEVKVGDQQWLTATARLFDGSTFAHILTAITCFADEERDADAIVDTLKDGLREQGITTWLDDSLVAVCVDGASVLLSGLPRCISSLAPNVMTFYCAAHRTQRVDFDVTEVF